jgi:hypothetical protein
MNSIVSLMSRFIKPVMTIPFGTYHYQTPPDAPKQYRMHLRILPDGMGMLILNASTVLHLNQTATEYAYHLVKGTPADNVANLVSKRYHVGIRRAQEDYQDLADRILYMIDTPDLDPVSYLDIERIDPYSTELTAPYRLDCAITYQVEPGTPPNIAPGERVRRELSTDEWVTILKKAWDAGIPHIIFTGTEATLRADLVELIRNCELLGQVTGLLTNGLRLADKPYLDTLLNSGLDHLMLVLDHNNPACWKAIETIMPQDIHTTVHITWTTQNIQSAPEILKRLSELGVKTLSLSSPDDSLADAARQIRSQVASSGFNLVWDLPVPYSASNPVAVEIAEDETPKDGAGQAWLYVEPDGDVTPSQGNPRVLGNMLSDEWQTIWEKR